MEILHNQFLAEVEGYLQRTATNPTAFGQQALRDPRFVFDLRRGRACSTRTVDRVRAFMRAAEAAAEGKGAAA